MTLPSGVAWYFWRPVHAGLGRLIEVQRDWSLCDLAEAHAILDAFDAAKVTAAEEG